VSVTWQTERLPSTLAAITGDNLGSHCMCIFVLLINCRQTATATIKQVNSAATKHDANIIYLASLDVNSFMNIYIYIWFQHNFLVMASLNVTRPLTRPQVRSDTVSATPEQMRTPSLYDIAVERIKRAEELGTTL